ncbi:MAG TPA: EAL domain-containing protein [Solirubrobacteraceae bacterium]|nr:EAL domain-containing protein [Solirubrobacteraceae bacterium]
MLATAERLAGLGALELQLPSGTLRISAGLGRVLGVAGRRLSLAELLELVHPSDRALVSEAIDDCRRDGHGACELRLVRADGSQRILSLRLEMARGESPTLVRGAALDVTDERASDRERLAAEEIFRHGFDSSPVGMALSEAAVRGRCLRVNDAMCELLGRRRDELLGRSLMELATHPADRPRLRRARAGMLRGGRPFRSEHRYLRADGSVAWGLLHVAPMLRADGSVHMFYSQLIDITERKEREAQLERTVADATWLGRVRDALDEHRLLLYSQPIVDLQTGETVQNELLLRLRERDGTIVGPREFLPVVERYGLIAEIDRWVLRQAVRSAAAGIPTELNLSARSISDPSVIDELAFELQRTGADPSLVVVEVTETALMDQTEAGSRFARALHALGCGLALDDFGTGFSSLSYLKRLPADYLKIDAEFVRELASSETDARVIRGVVWLAREFGQTTIAEGVEDARTMVLLRELGVDRAQGYLLGHPEPRAQPPADDAAPGPLTGDRSRPPGGSRRRSQARGGRAHTRPGARAEVVRAAFAAFAARDLPGMLSRCHDDVVLRPSVAARAVARAEPYVGHAGLRAYLQDVACAWEQFELRMPTFRETGSSVIGFGRTEARPRGGRAGADSVSADVVWIARVEDGLIRAIEVFEGAAG